MFREFGSKRLVFALLVVGAGLAVLALMSWSESLFEAVPGSGESLESRMEETSCEEFPAWFWEELWVASDASDLRMTADESVFGVVVPRPTSEVVPEMERALLERGWLGLSSGVEGCATFLKEEGTCRWAMVSCAEVAGSTSVVIQVQRVG